MHTNRPIVRPRNHEGVVTKNISGLHRLRRSVLSCLLWEDEFYEEGVEIAKRIVDLISYVPPHQVAALAIEAREDMKLRHVPLLIVRAMAKNPAYRYLVGSTLARVIQRPDELAEFLALYWKDGRCPLSAQVKKGLALAFQKFDAYSLAKYNRDGAIKLRDVLFLCRAKPKDPQQDAVWKKLIAGTLEAPDTWEVSLSAAGPEGDKRAEWVRLLAAGKLGALALLRNLRNMEQAGVERVHLRRALANMQTERVLPFRFIAAARHAPGLEPELEQAMFRCLAGMPKFSGRTVLLVDTSPSMAQPLSGKSDLKRRDAALGLAILLRELCHTIEVVAFSQRTATVPARRGFALGDAIDKAVESNGTLLGNAVRKVAGTYDRLIVLTDEESQDTVPDPTRGSKAYMINVASTKNGLGYGAWLHIDGFSEAVIDYIRVVENSPGILP